MTFLNPIWLWALPLVLLPIVIHLLNQRRHRTIDWGAMQFLLSAKRMSRGMARIRQILIMAARMLVIAGLIFVICRPLSSGLLGTLTGGKPETIIVLLDRSASMQQQDLQTGETKLSTGINKLVAALETVGDKQPIVLIESGNYKPISVESPTALGALPATTPTESQADVPALMEAALNYISDNQTGRTDVWICSDAAINDWSPESSRWKSLNSGYSQLEGIRFHVLNFAKPPSENLAILVDDVQRIGTADQSELSIDVTINRTSQDISRIDVPVTFTINGIRSVINVELEGESAQLLGHRIPIDGDLKTGWGQATLATDANNSDNNFFFAFSEPPVRRTVIVAEKELTTRAIELAAATTTQSGLEFGAEQVRPDQVDGINWQQTAFLVWQAPLPQGTVAKQVQSFLDSGRTVLFLPPGEPDDSSFAGFQWGPWQRAAGAGAKVQYWNNDAGLLKKTRNGNALRVDELLIYRHCDLTGEQRVLAKLDDGSPLLSRMTSTSGSMYFLTTWPVSTHSSLDREAVTLFAVTHRAIEAGTESLGAAKQFDAGSLPARAVAQMPVLAPAASDTSEAASLGQAIAELRPLRAGVYGDADQLIAINRPTTEDATSPLANAELASLFDGLDFQIIDDTLESGQSLASEIWKAFVVLMGLALLAEALLCLPPKPAEKSETLAAPVSPNSARAA